MLFSCFFSCFFSRVFFSRAFSRVFSGAFLVFTVTIQKNMERKKRKTSVLIAFSIRAILVRQSRPWQNATSCFQNDYVTSCSALKKDSSTRQSFLKPTLLESEPPVFHFFSCFFWCFFSWSLLQGPGFPQYICIIHSKESVLCQDQ